MSTAKKQLLADDIETISQKLSGFSAYDFSKDLSLRMANTGLTQSRLALRVQVTSAMVGKWLNKGAKPHGKERFKELGMALEMNEAELNSFLLANCYPKLYMKNPLDIACRFVLTRSAGNKKAVSIYRDFLRLYQLNDYTLHGDPTGISTSALSREFGNATSVKKLEALLLENANNFRAANKSYLPHAELIRFVQLYLGDKSIWEHHVTGELPTAIMNLLYPLVSDKAVAIRGLRSKLIVFGLYENMSEQEIDTMLTIAKLPLISAPSSKADYAILCALRSAHERYPYYELENAEKVLPLLSENELPDLTLSYKEQKRRAKALADYYDAHKGDEEKLFEENYTNFSDKGILHYALDVLTLLVKSGALKEKEIHEYTALTKVH